MKRKAIQLAGKTIVISLPTKWVKRQGIKKGNELEVEEKDNRLTVTASKEMVIEKAHIDSKDDANERLIRWQLSALHKSGYDEIEVSYESPETVRIIHEVVKELFIGFAITEQTRSRCVLRSIAKEVETELDTALRRAFLVTLSMGDSLAECLKTGRIKELPEILPLEHTNNQLTNFCERVLIKKGYKEYRKTCFAYTIAWNLEKLCDNYKYVIEYLSQAKNPELGKETADFVEEANNLLRSYYEIYYKFDNEKLNELAKEKGKLELKGRSLFGNTSMDEATVISLMMQHITQLYDFSASFIAINS